MQAPRQGGLLGGDYPGLSLNFRSQHHRLDSGLAGGRGGCLERGIGGRQKDEAAARQPGSAGLGRLAPRVFEIPADGLRHLEAVAVHNLEGFREGRRIPNGRSRGDHRRVVAGDV